jgi:hypothetical protein
MTHTIFRSIIRSMPLSMLLIMLALLVGCQSVPTSADVSSGAKPAETNAPPAAPAVTIPEGTLIEARLDQGLSTERNRPGDKFDATLDQPLTSGDRVILQRGARIQGHVTNARPSGHLEGRAVLGITLDTIEYGGRSMPITTNMDTKTSQAHKKRNLEVIGGTAGLGALIGAIAGGGKGAAIGAGAGAGAGTAGAAATGQFNVEVPAETVFTFRLTMPVELHE